jgi:hypothetical protein
VFSAWSVTRAYKGMKKLVLSCRELGRVLEMAVQGDYEEMARKEFGCEKKISCVI